MKTRKLIAILLALATVLAITAACGKDDDLKPEDVTVYVTNAEGETVTDKNGEAITIIPESVSVEYITNEKGEIKLDGDKQETVIHYVVTEKDDKGNVVTKEHTIAATTAPDETTKLDLDAFEDLINGEGTTVEVETLPAGKPVTENKKLLEKTFSTDNFYIDMSVENEAGIPMSLSFGSYGSNTYIGMNVNFMGLLKMNYATIQKGTTAYVLDKSSKTYIKKTDVTDLDTTGIEEMKKTFVVDSDANYISTTIVTSKGKTYICEEYKSDYGTSKYYFDQSTEELKRIEHDNSGTKNVITVKKFVKNPDESYFSVPKGYKEVSEDKFADSMEGLFGSMDSLGSMGF